MAELHRHAKKIFIGLLIAAGIVVLLMVIALVSSPASAPQRSAAAPVIVQTAKGVLTPGVPGTLLLDPSADLAGGYTVKYSTGNDLYAASWTSAHSLDYLLSLYKAYFKNHDWRVMNESTSEFSRGIAATDGSGSAVISLVDNGDSRTIAVSYMKR